jgi:hypothetical protein
MGNGLKVCHLLFKKMGKGLNVCHLLFRKMGKDLNVCHLLFNKIGKDLNVCHLLFVLDLFPLFMKNIFSSSTSNVMYLLTFALYIYKSTVKLWCLELAVLDLLKLPLEI